jgi:hypothetical protein
VDEGMRLLRVGKTDFAFNCEKLISIGLVADKRERPENHLDEVTEVRGEEKFIAICLEGMDYAVNINLLSEANAKKVFEQLLEEINKQEEEGYPESPTMEEEE